MTPPTSSQLSKKKKTRWSYANGCTWSVKDDDHVLFIEGSGTSGMLRFKTFSGDFFTLVPGIHNLVSLVHLQGDVYAPGVVSYGLNCSPPLGSLHVVASIYQLSEKNSTIASSFYRLRHFFTTKATSSGRS